MTNVNTVTIEAMQAQINIVNETTAKLNEMFEAFKAQSIVTETVELSQEERNTVVRNELEDFIANTTIKPLLDELDEEMDEEDEEEVRPTMAEILKKAEAEVKAQEEAQEAEAEEESEDYNEKFELQAQMDGEYAAEQEWESRGEQEYEPTAEELAEYEATQSAQNLADSKSPVVEETVAPAKPSILDRIKLTPKANTGVMVENQKTVHEGAAELEDVMARLGKKKIEEAVFTEAPETVEEVSTEEVAETVTEVVETVQETVAEVVQETKQEVISTETQSVEQSTAGACVIASPVNLNTILNSGRLSHHHKTHKFIKTAAEALRLTILGMVNRGVTEFHVCELDGPEIFILPFAWNEIIKEYPHLELVVYTNNGTFKQYCDSLEEEKAKNIYSPKRMSLALRKYATRIVEVKGNAFVLRKAALVGATEAIRFMPHGQTDGASKLYTSLPGTVVQVCSSTMLATKRQDGVFSQRYLAKDVNFDPKVVKLTQGSAPSYK